MFTDRRCTARGLTLGALIALVCALPATASAQRQGRSMQRDRRVSVEARGGVALPVGRLDDLVAPGPSFGLQVNVPVSNRLALAVQTDVDVLGGNTLTSSTAPDMRLWRYGAAVEANLLPPARRWSLVTNLGVGATTFDTDTFQPAGQTASTDWTHTYFTTNAGMRLAYDIRSRFGAFVGAEAHWAASSRDDTAVLRDLDPTRLKTFRNAWSVPILVGVKVST